VKRGAGVYGLLALAVFVVILGTGALALGVVHGGKTDASRSPHSPSPAPRPSSLAAASVINSTYAKLQTALASRGRHAAAGILDLKTGAQVLYNGDLQFETASIVKVDILSTLLWQLQNQNGHLSTQQKTLATDMIIESDNAAASALWTQIGRGTGLAKANKAFGLQHTIPGAGTSWGLTKTTVADQLRLLTVVSTDGPLAQASRDYVLGLMSKVVSSQRWGVPHAAGADASKAYVKNGWLQRSADGYKWIINSIGRIVDEGHDWLVVALTNFNATMDDGVDLAQQAAGIAVDGLRAG
jgi:hypothetical protein